MNIFIQFILISFSFSFGYCNKPCSREGSRIVRDYFTRALGPIYEKNHVAIPLECVLSPMRDIFYRQELNKVKLSNDKWLCKYCNKTFYSEYYLDIHFNNRHNETLLKNEQSVCLSDYCSVFRCDILKKRKKSLKSLNPLTRGSKLTKRKTQRIVNEEQLTILRMRCSSIINQCIPQSVHYDRRVQLQHQMYAEVCAFLTGSKYFEFPTYRQPLINFTTIFCLVIFIGMCLVGIGVVTHSDWKLDDIDEPQNESQSVNNPTSSLSSTSTNDVGHSPKNNGLSVRQRVRFKQNEGECQHSHHHHHHHHEHM